MKLFFKARCFLYTLLFTLAIGQPSLVFAAEAPDADEVLMLEESSYLELEENSYDLELQDGVIPRVIGGKDGDLVFTPLVPCRLLDTRFGTGNFAGPIADLTTISIQTNINDFSAQGGNAGPCGMPTDTDASAIVIIVTAVEPPNTGHLRVFPFSAPFPNASVVNFIPNQDIANNTIVPQCIGCDSDISIFVATQANVIVDVIGYFNPPVVSKESQTTFSEGPAEATGTGSITIVQKSITVPGPGRIVAIGSSEAFCDSCVVGTADGFMNITTSSSGNASTSPRSFFRLVPNASNSVTRTLEFMAPSSGEYTFYLRGARSAGSAQIGFYRGQLQLMYFPN